MKNCVLRPIAAALIFSLLVDSASGAAQLRSQRSEVRSRTNLTSDFCLLTSSFASQALTLALVAGVFPGSARPINYKPLQEEAALVQQERKNSPPADPSLWLPLMAGMAGAGGRRSGGSGDPSALVRDGVTAYLLGDYGAAKEKFQDALESAQELEPLMRRQALQYLFKIYLWEKNWDEILALDCHLLEETDRRDFYKLVMIPAIKKYLKTEPADKKAWEALIFSHLFALDTEEISDEVIAIYRDAVAANPDWITIWGSYADALISRGQPGEARRVLDEMIEKTHGQPPEILADAYFTRGAKLEELGDLPGARTAYREAIKHDPEYPIIGMDLEIPDEGDPLLLWENIAFGAALSVGMTWVIHGPLWLSLLSSLAAVLVHEAGHGNLRNFKIDWRKGTISTGTSPRHPLWGPLPGLLLGQAMAVIGLYLHFTAPSDILNALPWGLWFITIAFSFLLINLLATRALPEWWVRRTGHKSDGNLLADRKRQQSPDNQAEEDLLLQGLEARAQGDWKTAMKHYRDAIVLNPSNAIAWTQLAIAAFLMDGKGKVAADAAQMAVALKANSWEPYHILYAGYMSDQRWEDALAILQRALDSGVQSPELYTGIATAHFASDHFEEAIQWLRNGRILYPQEASFWHREGNMHEEYAATNRDLSNAGRAQHLLLAREAYQKAQALEPKVVRRRFPWLRAGMIILLVALPAAAAAGWHPGSSQALVSMGSLDHASLGLAMGSIFSTMPDTARLGGEKRSPAMSIAQLAKPLLTAGLGLGLLASAFAQAIEMGTRWIMFKGNAPIHSLVESLGDKVTEPQIQIWVQDGAPYHDLMRQFYKPHLNESQINDWAYKIREAVTKGQDGTLELPSFITKPIPRAPVNVPESHSWWSDAGHWISQEPLLTAAIVIVLGVAGFMVWQWFKARRGRTVGTVLGPSVITQLLRSLKNKSIKTPKESKKLQPLSDKVKEVILGFGELAYAKDRDTWVLNKTRMERWMQRMKTSTSQHDAHAYESVKRAIDAADERIRTSELKQKNIFYELILRDRDKNQENPLSDSEKTTLRKLEMFYIRNGEMKLSELREIPVEFYDRITKMLEPQDQDTAYYFLMRLESILGTKDLYQLLHWDAEMGDPDPSEPAVALTAHALLSEMASVRPEDHLDRKLWIQLEAYLLIQGHLGLPNKENAPVVNALHQRLLEVPDSKNPDRQQRLDWLREFLMNTLMSLAVGVLILPGLFGRAQAQTAVSNVFSQPATVTSPSNMDRQVKRSA